MFEALHDPTVVHTLIWANGADLAPAFLRDNIEVTAEPPVAADGAPRRR